MSREPSENATRPGPACWRPTARSLGLLAFWAMAAILVPPHALAEPTLSLEEILEAARLANARLPVTRLGEQIGSERVREAQAALGPTVQLGGDLRWAPNGVGYNATGGNVDEERLQVLAQQPLYDGALRARIRGAEAQHRSAAARHRVAEKDLQLEVRSRYAELLQIASELTVRQGGIDRLRRYEALIRQRQAAGEGLMSDLLRTEVRLAGEQATLVDARQRAATARLGLNDLMGRDPVLPLELVPLPPPTPPASVADEPWLGAPEVNQAEADRQAAESTVAETQAGRRPHLDLLFDAGLLGPGLFAPGASGNVSGRLHSDFGASLTLNLNWPVWDAGTYRARIEQAALGERQAGQSVLVVRQQARLEWRRAQADLAHLFEAIGIRTRALPLARDAYLQAESTYRGGLGRSLEVLDAYAALVDAQVAHAAAIYQYRLAEARAHRWGEP